MSIGQVAMIDSPPAIIIEHDPGGQLGEYIERRGRYERGGLRVEIRGECLSSCTVLVSLPPERVCVGPHAVLGFHLPVQTYAGVQTASGSSYFGSVMMEYYPERVKQWVVTHGGLTHEMIYLRGDELRGMFRSCQ